MTPVRAVRLFGAAITVVVAGASGTYLLVYLYRWEWSRAIVSGIFFLAAELALATGLLLGRLRRLERRVNAPDQPADRAAAVVHQSRPARPAPFAWLRVEDRTGVFVPVLLGAGVVMSALALVVQRVAEVAARATVEPSIVRDLARLAPPAGGLRPELGLPPAAPGPGATGRRRGRSVMGIAAIVAAMALGWVAIDEIGDATQTRPETADDVDTVALVDVSSRWAGSVEDAVLALWVACRPRLTGEARLVSVTEIDDDRAVIVLAPGLGERRWRRFEGCVEDMTLNRTTASADRVEPLGG